MCFSHMVQTKVRVKLFIQNYIKTVTLEPYVALQVDTDFSGFLSRDLGPFLTPVILIEIKCIQIGILF